MSISIRDGARRTQMPIFIPHASSHFGAFRGTRHFGGHVTYFGSLGNFGFRPAFRGRRTRPTSPSTRSTKAPSPSGLPVRLWLRRSLSSSSGSTLSSKPCQSCTMASIGATRTRQSSRPDRCALALLQGHSSGHATSRARTGFNSTYLAAASRYASSMTNDANRPCHKYPRHFSRKLIRCVT